MAKNRAYKIVSTDDKDLAKVQENVANFVEPLQNSQIWQGVLYKGISLSSASTTLVEHKLNRDPQGWIIVSKNANSNIWENNTGVITKRFIGLDCSADVIVNIWIF